MHSSTAPASGRSYIFRFLSLWTTAMVVMFVIALTSNIDWARPQFEKMLSQNLSRKVSLGHLSWNFSFNGLAIASSWISVADRDQRNPFLKAAHSEIGIAFLPLLRHHKVVLRHIVMYRPELWAVRFKPGRWNYSDLLDSIILAKFIDAHDATVHIRDSIGVSSQSTTAIHNYDFQHVELRFVHPHERKSWPFYLSAQLPRRGYTSLIRVSALGHGKWKDWRANDYTFDIQAKQFNPKDLAPYASYLSPIAGMLDLDVKGHGSFLKGISGTATSTIRNFELSQPGNIVELPAINTIFSTNFALSGDPQCVECPSGTKAAGSRKSSHMLLNLVGNPAGPRFTGHLSGRQIALDHLISLLPSQLRHYFPVTKGNVLSDVQGTVAIDSDGSVAISSLTISSPHNRKIVVNGNGNVNSQKFCLKLTGQNIDLSSIAAAIPQFQNYTQLHAAGSTIKSSDNTIKLLGNINFTACTNNGTAGSLNRVEATFLNDTIVIGKQPELKNLTGSVVYDGKRLFLDNVLGTINGDSFTLNGTIAYTRTRDCSLDLSAERVNLKHLSAIFNLLHLNVPVLKHESLYGTVKALDVKVRGPSVEVVFTPETIYYRAERSEKPIQATGGKITYRNDCLEMSNLDLALKQGHLTASGLITQFNSTPAIKQFQLKGSAVDLSEISHLLGNPLLSESVQQEYKPYLASVQLPSLHGKASGNISWQQPRTKSKKDYKLDGAISLTGASGRLNKDGPEFSGVSGLMSLSGNELTLQNLKGMLGANKFLVSGSITDYQQPALASWQIDLKSRLRLHDILMQLPSAHELDSRLQASGSFRLHAHLAGDRNNNLIVFSCHTDPHDRLTLVGSAFGVYSPSTIPVSLDGSLISLGGAAGSIELKNCYLIAGDSIVQASGKYRWYGESGKEPSFETHIRSVQPLRAEILAQMLERVAAQNIAAGTIYGSLDASGTLSRTEAKAFIGFSDLSFPQYNLKTASGTMDCPVWILLNLENPESRQVGTAFGAPGSIANVKFTNLEGDTIKVTDVTAQLATQEHNDHIRVALKNGSANIFNGSLHFAGWLDAVEHSLHLGLDANNIDSAMAISQLLNQQNEVAGKTVATAVVDTSGMSSKELVSNLSGHGAFRISDGIVYRFGQFQERISQVNLLHQGVFGFNLNNLLQTMVPVRNGKFHDLAGTFEIQKGIVSLNDLRYDADDMRLWASGTANLPLDSLDMEVAGRIPRVLPSIIGGPMGRFSRTITLQNFVGILTLHKLESLPSFPVLGDIGNDRPRTFSFQILGNLGKPHSISQSIEKTFAWMPAMPGASAHPLPALSKP